MFVKICGITNLDDAQAAVEMGAQALGFIQFLGSPRYINPVRLQQWIGSIPEHVWKVGVFVDEAPDRVEAVCDLLGLDIAQLHGSETPADHPRRVKVWRAFRVSDTAPPNGDYPADGILLDGPGGGRTFDWSLCSLVARPLIIAGGLDEHNIHDAIQKTNPWGVDVSSGVESSPGRKDHQRMRNFIKAALQ